MDTIKLTRKEFFTLFTGLAIIPPVIFLTGFYLGSTQQKVQGDPPLVDTVPLVFEATISDDALSSDSLSVVKQADVQNVIFEADWPVEVVDDAIALEEPTIVLATINPGETQQHLFAVQVGNFSNLDNADGYKTRLRSKGVNAQVIGNASIKGAATYRVIVGLYTDQSAAKTAAEQHEFRQKQDAYVALIPT
ncbi:MAG: SPOR domain-containing protein [Candidatus Polarisedimenticolaceae bacterium]|nr:SPOR domain-containing protein [Candidatus Polarisedimenticolaceae bacterium]